MHFLYILAALAYMQVPCVTLDFLGDLVAATVQPKIEERAVQPNIEERAVQPNIEERTVERNNEKRAVDIPPCAIGPAPKAFIEQGKWFHEQAKAFQSHTSLDAAPLVRRAPTYSVYVHFHLVVSEGKRNKYTAAMLDNQVCLSESMFEA